jgi:hypothetical protein
MSTLYFHKMKLFLLVSALPLVVLTSASGAQCEADARSLLGKERELGESELAALPPGIYDKVFSLVSDGGIYQEDRFCAETTSVPELVRFTVFGKPRGTFQHMDYWSGRDLTLLDASGHIRVIKTNVSIDFERVLIFDEKGGLVVPVDRSETSQATYTATAVLLNQYSAGHIDEAIILIWMLHYHGEANGADNFTVFASWLLDNKEAALRFARLLDKGTAAKLAASAGWALAERPVQSGERAVVKFARIYPAGASEFTDLVRLRAEGLN